MNSVTRLDHAKQAPDYLLRNTTAFGILTDMESGTRRLFGKVFSWWSEPAVTFVDAFNPRNNSIGFIRLCLASLVIVSHAYPLGGLFGMEIGYRISHGQADLGGFAVDGFFIMSGFLIAGSFDHLKSTTRFLWHRFLRIMPGFWVSLLVVAFGFGALFYYHINHTIKGYFSAADGGPIKYLTQNFFLTMNQYDISGLTAGLKYPNAFNGSVWSLVYEFTCYLVVAVFGFFGILKKNKIVVLVAFIVAYVLFAINHIIPGSIIGAIPSLKNADMLRLLTVFLGGSVFYLYRSRIILDNRYFTLAILVLMYTFRRGGFVFVMPILLLYVLMYIAARCPIRSFDKKYDLSYGIYIYAFPVQQTFSLYGLNRLNIVVYSLLVFAATLPLAFLSYVLIEKPAMKLKNKSIHLSPNYTRFVKSSYKYVIQFGRPV